MKRVFLIVRTIFVELELALYVAPILRCGIVLSLALAALQCYNFYGTFFCLCHLATSPLENR